MQEKIKHEYVDAHALYLASMFHDIGKLRIPDKILNKPSFLSHEEFEFIKLHPSYSYKMLKELGFAGRIALITKHHHENYDGTGYPNGLKGDEIPLESRMIRIADTFDALTTDRVYKERFSKDKALNIMKAESHHFDPILLKCFFNLIKE